MAIIGVLSFITMFFLVVAIATFAGLVKHPIDRRIDQIRIGQSLGQQKSVFSNKTDTSMVASLGERVAPADPEKKVDSKQRLSMAGYYSDSAYNTYWGFKIVFMTIVPLFTFALITIFNLPLNKSLLPAVLAIGGGLFLPDIFLWLKKRRRHEQIFCGLPDALDLLVVCIESGLGLDAALQKVSEELHISNKVLSEELHITCANIRLGKPRNEALHDLGERTGYMDLKTLTAVLIQASKFGTSIAQALRVHSEDLRTRRCQRAEELAAKTTVKLIFPLVLFIFPSIFVVLGGPAIIKILENFMK